MDKKYELTKKDILKLVLFVILISGLIFYPQILTAKPKYIEYKGVELKETDYNIIQEKFGDYLDVIVCDIESRNCIKLLNIDDAQKYIDFLKGKE